MGSDLEISRKKSLISFTPDDSFRDLSGFDLVVIYEKHNSSPNPIVILSFDVIFLEIDVPHATSLKGQRSRINHNFTMDVDPGYKYIEKLREGVQW